MAKAAAAEVRVCFSHPCFEFWMLLHYEDCAAPMAGRCAQARRRLARHRSQLTRQFRVDEFAGRYVSARERARRISQRHAADGVAAHSRCDPTTKCVGAGGLSRR